MRASEWRDLRKFYVFSGESLLFGFRLVCVLLHVVVSITPHHAKQAEHSHISPITFLSALLTLLFYRVWGYIWTHLVFDYNEGLPELFSIVRSERERGW